MKNKKQLKAHLDQLVLQSNHRGFIPNDPICIPYLFTKKEDIELAAFIAAIFSWGQRKTIINKSKTLLELMDNQPYDFILNHQDSDLKAFESFVHRTFNSTDLLYFIYRLQRYYKESGGLEQAFSSHISKENETIEPALMGFYQSFFDDELAPKRSKKHIASPEKNSTCKRLCMFLRWMVRKDDVDFGIWKSIRTSQLMMPLDVHVERQARALQLLNRKQRDWKSVVELTNNLKQLDKQDPVRYDFALFGATVMP